VAIDPSAPGPELLGFLTERHLATLTTLRPDGTPHVVPVGVTYDPATRTARVITSGRSAKARHLRDGGGRVAVCQVDGRRWSKDPRAPRPSQARAGALHEGHAAQYARQVPAAAGESRAGGDRDLGGPDPRQRMTMRP
jgi:hypothetical protein